MWIYETEKPVSKMHLEQFLKHGYSSALHFSKSGIFYVQKKTINATCSFGTRKITVKSSGNEVILKEFESLLEKIVNGSP